MHNTKNIYTSLILIFVTTLSHTQAFEELATISKTLKETSAVEQTNNIWVVEDSGNANTLYALNAFGDIIKQVKVTNATNKDWEDLTSDSEGNLYIGDFGNNDEERNVFSIYRIEAKNLNTSKTQAKRIDFTLPKKVDSKDFEAFFLYKNTFYIFSKEKKKPILISVPNQVGKHTAKLEYQLNFKGKHLKITSADISPDGQKIALLNHDKVLIAEGFNTEKLSQLQFKKIPLKHNSQKEGLCFINNTTLLITDESKKNKGGKLYKVILN